MKAIDINPATLSMSLNNGIGFKTNFGGVLSLILGLLTLSSIFAFGRNLFYKTNPVINITQDWIQTPVLSKTKPIVFFNVMDARAQAIPEIDRMMNYSLVQIDADGNRKGPGVLYSYLNLVPCTNLDFFKENYRNITSYLIGDDSLYKCLNNSDPRLQDLEGSYGNVKSFSWAIVGQICKNTTENGNHCLPIETIESKLNSYRSQIGILNNYIDSSNYLEPIQFTFYSNVFRSSLYNSRQDVYYLTLIKYFSDNGFLLDDNNEFNAYSVLRHQSEALFSKNPEFTLRLIITLENLTIKYQRLYDKIQKLAADVGGIIKFLSIILAFISEIYGRVSVLEHIFKLFKTSDNLEKATPDKKCIQYDNYTSKSKISKLDASTNKDKIEINNLDAIMKSLRKNKNQKDDKITICDTFRFTFNCFHSKSSKILINVDKYLIKNFNNEKLIILLEEYNEVCNKLSINKNEIKRNCYEKLINCDEPIYTALNNKTKILS